MCRGTFRHSLLEWRFGLVFVLIIPDHVSKITSKRASEMGKDKRLEERFGIIDLEPTLISDSDSLPLLPLLDPPSSPPSTSESACVRANPLVLLPPLDRTARLMSAGPACHWSALARPS